MFQLRFYFEILARLGLHVFASHGRSLKPKLNFPKECCCRPLCATKQ